MERATIKKDFIAMSVLLLFSLILYFILIPNHIPQRASVSGDVTFTSRTFPSILAIVLGGISAIGAVKNGILYMKDRDEQPATDKSENSSLLDVIRPYIVFSIIVVYGVLFSKIGMIISSVICLPLLLIAYGERKVLHYIEVGLFCSVMYLIFRHLLNIPLP